MQLFTSSTYSSDELKRIYELDPEKDISFLPSLKGKEFFDAVEDLSICRNPEVRKYLYVYLTRGRQYVIRSIERSNLYIGILREITKNNPDIPGDIVLLPLLESGFDPFAVSRSKAVGLWQFLAPTSRVLGLKSNSWVEERRDIEKSTRAALRHLRNLSTMFDSWELILAAYNGGAGHVKRAQKKSGVKNYWELRKTGQLSRETSEYVARYAALMVIFKNQRLWGINDEIIQNYHDTEEIKLKYPVNIRHLAGKTCVPLYLIQRLNPELKGNLTPPYEKNYTLRIPESMVEKIEKDKKNLYTIRFSKLKKHVVRKGECLYAIAKRYNIPTRRIILFNDIENPGCIHPGQNLYIPI